MTRPSRFRRPLAGDSAAVTVTQEPDAIAAAVEPTSRLEALLESGERLLDESRRLLDELDDLADGLSP